MFGACRLHRLTRPQHPSLRAYKHHVALLQIQLSHWQQKIKFARTQVRNLLSSFLPTDPPCVVYAAHLASISIHTTPKPTPVTPHLSSAAGQPSSPHIPHGLSSSPAYIQNPQDIHAALASVSDMEALSLNQRHKQVTLLAQILRMRILVAASMWGEVSSALERVETSLGLSYEPMTTPKPRTSGQNNAQDQPKQQAMEEVIFFDDPFEAAVAVHMLVMAVVYFTHIGSAADATPRLSHLHALLDGGALDKFPQGIVEACTIICLVCS